MFQFRIHFIIAGLLILILTACSSNKITQQGEWTKLGSSKDEQLTYYIDTKGGFPLNNMKRFKTRSVLKQPKEILPGFPAKKYQSEISTWKMQCENTFYSLEKTEFYDEEETLLLEQDFTTSFHKVAPNTVNEKYYRYICHGER